MTDVTVNPLATPQAPPARSPDGTLLNQQALPTPSTTTDSSPTSQTPDTTKTPPSTEPKPEDKSTLLNQKDPENPPTGAPEKYTDFKLPEGLTLEPKAIEDATKVFKNLNLSQDQAQSLVDFHAAQIQSAIDGPFRAVVDLKTSWESTLRETYGKDIERGGKLNTQIGRFIDSMPPKVGTEFRQAMDLTLAGSNPAFVAAMKWVSEQLSEGTTVKGGGPSPLGQTTPAAGPKSIAAAMYPHLKSSNS